MFEVFHGQANALVVAFGGGIIVGSFFTVIGLAILDFLRERREKTLEKK